MNLPNPVDLAIPGFIESHGHYLGLGRAKMILDLTTAKRWDDIVDMVSIATRDTKIDSWIAGRGWHQEKWTAPPSHSAASANSFCGFGLSAQSAAFREAARRYPMTPASSSNSAASATSSVRVFIPPSYDHKSSLCNSFWDEPP